MRMVSLLQQKNCIYNLSMVERRKTKDEDSDEIVEFQRLVSREQVHEWSRILHRSAPTNKYYIRKIPWRTILMCFLFLIGGIVFLTLGLQDLV